MNVGHRMVWIFAIALALATPAASHAAPPAEAVLYKDPACGCCAEYAKYLERNGFAVTIIDTGDLAAVKAENGVPQALAGCHTLLVGGYVVEAR